MSADRGMSSPGLSVSVDLLQGYGPLVRSLGGDASLLIARAGLHARDLVRAGALVPIEAMAGLLEISAAALDCADFGMRLAAWQSHQPFAPLDELISNAPTVRAALLCACDHSDAFIHGITSILERDMQSGRPFLRVEMEGAERQKQLVEQLLLVAQRGILRLSGDRARSRAVSIRHDATAPIGAYAHHFRVPVRFGQDFNGILLSDEDLAAPVVGSDPRAFEAASAAFKARFPMRPLPIETRVRLAIERALSDGSCSRARVAARLTMHERTLHRRLADAGTTFHDIQDGVRRGLALRYLARADLPLNEVTGRLGYSELPVLTRSCRRWFAAPPAAVRRKLLSETRSKRFRQGPAALFDTAN